MMSSLIAAIDPTKGVAETIKQLAEAYRGAVFVLLVLFVIGLWKSRELALVVAIITGGLLVAALLTLGTSLVIEYFTSTLWHYVIAAIVSAVISLALVLITGDSLSNKIATYIIAGVAGFIFGPALFLLASAAADLVATALHWH